MTTSANTLAGKIGTPQAPQDEEHIEEEELESTEEVEVEPDTEDETEEAEDEDTEEQDEDSLPDNIKEILQKNRKLVREAEKRARAAEKALEAKENGTEEQETDNRFRDLYINRSATAALAAAGLTSGTDRFLKMLDLDEVEVDENGEIDGLEDQIEGLKEDYPELFVKEEKAPKKAPVKADAAGRRGTPKANETSASKISARLLGKN